MGGGSTGFRAVAFRRASAQAYESSGRCKLTFFLSVDGDESLLGLLADDKLDIGAKLYIISWESGVVRWRTPRRVSAVPAQWPNIRLVLMLRLLGVDRAAHVHWHVAPRRRSKVRGHHLGLQRGRAVQPSWNLVAKSRGERLEQWRRRSRTTAVFEARQAEQEAGPCSSKKEKASSASS